MNLESWFSNISLFAMLGWVFLILYPRRKPWIFTLTGLIMPALMGIAYAVLFIPNFAGAVGAGAGYNSLTQVKTLFAHDALLLAGWIHYLAFDLAVGSYIAKQSDKIDLSRIIQTPLLLLTFLFGPIGLMAFVGLKFIMKTTDRVIPKFIAAGDEA